MLSTQRTLLRAGQAVLAGEPPGARGDVDRGRVGAPAHALGELLRRHLRFVERHPARERNPQPIADQHRLDVLAPTRPANELDLHVPIYTASLRHASRTRRVNAPRTAACDRVATRTQFSRTRHFARVARILLDARGRGRTVRRYRFADASDSEPAFGGIGTDVRAGRAYAATFGTACARTGEVGRRAPARACPANGRRREGPEEIGAADAAKTTRGLPASGQSRRGAVRTGAGMRRHTGCVRSAACATRCSTISIRSSTTRSRPTRRRSRSSRPRARARRGCSRVASRTAPARSRSRPRHVLAVTFTRKAAGELVSRIGRARRRRPRSPRARSTRSRSRSSAATRPSATASRPASSTARRALLGPAPGRAGARPRRSRSPTSRPRSSGPRRASIAPDGYEAAAERGRAPPPRGGRRGRRAVRRATRPRSARRHLIDFDDVLSRCADAIEHDEEFAAGQRWRFRHLFVDEFQDATPLQLRLLRAWLGDSHDLTRRRRPRAGDLRVRGRRRVAADRVRPHLSRRHDDRARPQLPQHARGRRARRGRARAGRRRPAPAPAKPSGPTAPPPTITAYDDDDAEATRDRRRVLARATRPACRGTAWPCSSAPTRSRRASRPRSPAAACRSASARRSASRPARRCARCSTSCAKPSERCPGRPFAHHLADLAADDETRRPTDDRRDRAERDATCRRRRAPHRDALLELGRDYLDAVGGVGSVAEFAAWLDTATGGGVERRARRRPRHVPPRQGPRVDTSCSSPGSSAGWSRSRGRRLGRGPGRGTTAPARGAEPGRGRAALLVGARPVGRRRPRAREPSPWLGLLEDEANHAPHGLLQARRAPVTISSTCAPRWRLRRRRARPRPRRPPAPLTLTVGRRGNDGRTPTAESREISWDDAMRSTLPLFPTDDGWPYPDAEERARRRRARPRRARAPRTARVRHAHRAGARRAAFPLRPAGRRRALDEGARRRVLGCSRAEAGARDRPRDRQDARRNCSEE